MPIIRVTSLSEPGLEVYGSLTERQLKSFYDDLGGLFIAESPKVIKVALDAGYEPVSVLCEESISRAMPRILPAAPETSPCI